MRFLADESCDFRVVKALREAGYDVKAIAEMMPGISDDEVAGLSVCEMRILITEDKDFGQLVYTKSQASCGIIFIRFPANDRLHLPDMVVRLVREHSQMLYNRFVIVQPKRIRITGIPISG